MDTGISTLTDILVPIGLIVTMIVLSVIVIYLKNKTKGRDEE